MRGFRLGVDYGTSHTVALLQSPDGQRRPLLFDGSPLLPSAVYASEDGTEPTLAVGRDAERLARVDPACFEPHPKRHIDAQELLLGTQVFPIVDVVAASLRRVHTEACRVGGAPPEAVVLTCPAGWGATRRAVLTEAAARAGMSNTTLVTEPVAAATYFTTVASRNCPVGRCLVVYDLGAGTFDVSVVRRTADGFVVLAVDGCEVGGLDFDAVVVERLRLALQAVDLEAWSRLTAPKTPPDQRHFRTFWDDARGAKELLSRQPSAPLYVPLLDRDAVVTREEFEQAAAPLVERTIDLTAQAIDGAQVTTADLAGVFLVGGATRMPLVATMLHRRFGIAPTVLEQPETVVAEGALVAATTWNASRTVAAVLTSPAPPPTVPPPVRPTVSVAPSPSTGVPEVTPWSAAWWRRWGAILALASLVAMLLPLGIGLVFW